MLRKFKNDDGNAVILLGIMLIVVTLAIGAMLLDITKAFQMKSAYNDAANKAAQSAIRYHNSKGYLTIESVGEAVRVYETVSRPGTIREGYMSSCVKPRSVEIKITMLKANGVKGQTYTINSTNVTDDEPKVLAGRFSPSLTELNRNTFEAQKYLGIEITLMESTPNVILPNTAKIYGEKAADTVKYNCQLLGINAAASQFIGKEGQYN